MCQWCPLKAADAHVLLTFPGPGDPVHSYWVQADECTCMVEEPALRKATMLLRLSMTPTVTELAPGLLQTPMDPPKWTPPTISAGLQTDTALCPGKADDPLSSKLGAAPPGPLPRSSPTSIGARIALQAHCHPHLTRRMGGRHAPRPPPRDGPIPRAVKVPLPLGGPVRGPGAGAQPPEENNESIRGRLIARPQHPLTPELVG